MKEIIQHLEKIQYLIIANAINTKEVLNFKETCLYLELSHSHLYKLTSTGNIPHYKPNGKKIYFKKSEINDWMLRHKTQSVEEIEVNAADYIMQKGKIDL